MELRPCIDIHNGKVKQLVGGSIQDQGDSAQENYISSQDAAWYARLFQEKGLKNGHVILLNSKDSAYYEQTRQQALSALQAYPGGLQVGGGITAENAREYLDAGASHVIVTSYVFRNGDISFENLNRMMDAVGKKRLVLDLSCRKKDGKYYIVTDRWQTYTRVALSEEILTMLSSFCDEFLIHGVDVEGKRSGIEQELITLLGAAYLLWLGIAILRHPTTPDAATQQAGSWNRWALKGLCISGLNPKVFLLFLALLPQFTDPEGRWPVALQMSALGSIHLLTCTLIYFLVGYGSKRLLTHRPEVARRVSMTSGAMMVAIAILLFYSQLK